MANKKKKVVNTKVHMKSNVKLLAIFLAIVLVLGIIFMNLAFTAIMILGILFIIWMSNIFNKKKKKRWVRVVFNTLVILVLLGAIAGVGGVAWFLNYIVENAPEFNEDALLMSQTTKIYDSNGVEIAELGTEKREIIKYEQLNEGLVDALIATEDSRFFQHNGFDAPRFLIASIKQVLGQSDAGGASTLTMQVAKNNYNADKATVTKGFEGITRKFTDIYMAVFKLEKNYSKQEIIEFYFNDHFLGNNAYGVEQAALTYFNKHAYELNISESALLVGLYKAPGDYDPFKHPEAAEARRSTVLKLMYDHGYITQEEREIANSISVTSLLNPQKPDQKYWSYLNTVVSEAQDVYGVNPNTTSLLIYTNMNSEYQTVIDDIMSGKTYQWDNPVVQAGIAVVDVKTGKIVAIGAGRNQEGNENFRNFNYATRTYRQIGSTAKPIFDYGPGMEFNNWSTYKLFDDSTYYYSSGQEVRNSDRSHWGVITLRSALANSRNVPALKAFQQTTQKQKIQFAQSLGVSLGDEFEETGYLHEAYSLGSFNGSNPLEMAGAYAAFANGGYYTKPYSISKIVFRDTGEVVTASAEKKQVMSSSTAFMITDCLKTAVTEGLSSAAKISGVNVAAKTGTTNYTAQQRYANGLGEDALNDAWIIGYDPETVISIWYGYEPISRQYWSNTASALSNRKRLFNAVGSKVFKKNGQDFEVPNTVVKVALERSYDVNAEPKLASEYTPTDMIVYEYFKKGTEPTEVSNAYKKLSNVTNLNGSYDEDAKTVTLTWKGVTPDDNLSESYGDFGYKVYKDGKFLGFTTNLSYTINNVTDPNGTYRVSAGYKNVSTVDSAGTVFTISYDINEAEYDAKLVVPAEKNYSLNASLESYDQNPSAKDVQVTKDGAVVAASVSISIKDSGGNTIANITTTAEGEYTITYSITYESYKTTLTRKIKIA